MPTLKDWSEKLWEFFKDKAINDYNGYFFLYFTEENLNFIANSLNVKIADFYLSLRSPDAIPRNFSNCWKTVFLSGETELLLPYLTATVLALTRTGLDSEIHANEYYHRLAVHTRDENVNQISSLIVNNFKGNLWELSWEKLAKYVEHNLEFKFFRPSSSGMRYVKWPQSQVPFSLAQMKNLRSIFYDLNLPVGGILSDDQIANIVNLVSQKTINEENLRYAATALISKEYYRWDGSPEEKRDDTKSENHTSVKSITLDCRVALWNQINTKVKKWGLIINYENVNLPEHVSESTIAFLKKPFEFDIVHKKQPKTKISELDYYYKWDGLPERPIVFECISKVYIEIFPHKDRLNRGSRYIVLQKIGQPAPKGTYWQKWTDTMSIPIGFDVYGIKSCHSLEIDPQISSYCFNTKILISPIKRTGLPIGVNTYWFSALPDFCINGLLQDEVEKIEIVGSGQNSYKCLQKKEIGLDEKNSDVPIWIVIVDKFMQSNDSIFVQIITKFGTIKSSNISVVGSNRNSIFEINWVTVWFSKWNTKNSILLMKYSGIDLEVVDKSAAIEKNGPFLNGQISSYIKNNSIFKLHSQPSVGNHVLDYIATRFSNGYGTSVTDFRRALEMLTESEYVNLSSILFSWQAMSYCFFDHNNYGICDLFPIKPAFLLVRGGWVLLGTVTTTLINELQKCLAGYVSGWIVNSWGEDKNERILPRRFFVEQSKGLKEKLITIASNFNINVLENIHSGFGMWLYKMQGGHFEERYEPIDWMQIFKSSLIGFNSESFSFKCLCKYNFNTFEFELYDELPQYKHPEIFRYSEGKEVRFFIYEKVGDSTFDCWNTPSLDWGIWYCMRFGFTKTSPVKKPIYLELTDEECKITLPLKLPLPAIFEQGLQAYCGYPTISTDSQYKNYSGLPSTLMQRILINMVGEDLIDYHYIEKKQHSTIDDLRNKFNHQIKFEKKEKRNERSNRAF
jgi:hypothetical protein